MQVAQSVSSFGKDFRKARIDGGYTLVSLARQLDVNVSSIGNWESGKLPSQFNLDVIFKMFPQLVTKHGKLLKADEAEPERDFKKPGPEKAATAKVALKSAPKPKTAKRNALRKVTKVNDVQRIEDIPALKQNDIGTAAPFAGLVALANNKKEALELIQKLIQSILFFRDPKNIEGKDALLALLSLGEISSQGNYSLMMGLLRHVEAILFLSTEPNAEVRTYITAILEAQVGLEISNNQLRELLNATK